jgi:ATP-dependent helicase/nuclease subunit B
LYFLHSTTSALYQKYKSQLHRLAVVFPNRRQAVFFKNHFKDIAEAPAFVPQLLTIEELVQQSSEWPIADPLVQTYELYQAYKKVCIEQGENETSVQQFEQFYPVGEMLLKDFAEADSFLVDINEICKVLYDLEAIEKSFEQLTEEQKEFLHRFWSSIKNNGKYQDIFLKLWKRLPAIYEQFHIALRQLGFTTLGMAYRQLTANVQGGFFSKQQPLSALPWSHIAFVGFNAFNKAEETILRKWQDDELASFWFDADTYYINDSTQEAGFFLRRNLHKLELKNSLPLHDIIGKKNSTIHVTAVQGHTAQAKLLSDWMNQLPTTIAPGTAAILLADESLLLPVLQSLPDNMQAVNVTMGYPVQQTILHSFFTLYHNILTDLGKNNNRSLHYSYVQQWMSHPLCDWNEETRTKLSAKMQRDLLIQVPVKVLQKHSAISDLLFLQIYNPFDLFARLRQLLQLIHTEAQTANDHFLIGFSSAVWQLIQIAEPLFARLKPAPTLEFMLQVIRKQLDGLTVPFEGEPLQGIQIMGLLESRGLDFEHVLLLGAAEGSLPKVSVTKTFLPDGIRRAFGLPVAEYQDAISAYVFYRLLHQCQHMHLVYNALVADNSTGEPSRFAKQLAFESNILFEYHYPTAVVKPSTAPTINITKTPDMLRILSNYYAGEKPVSVSPSQINSYLSCRLQYFYKNVASIAIPKELSEKVDAAVFGNIVHKLMERLYYAIKKHQGNWYITKESVDWMKSQLPFETEMAFRDVMMGKDAKNPLVLNGLQQVIKNVAVQYAEGFLNLDEAYTPFTVKEIEVNMKEPFAVTIGGSTKNLTLNGFIDRVDEKNGVYRMVDYKTGGDELDFGTIEKLFEREGKKHNKAALQTLIYSWMFNKKFPTLPNFEPALLPLRVMMQKGSNTRFYSKETKQAVSYETMGETLLEIEQRLRGLLEEIFDPEVPFDQTADLKICSYCDYNGICGRG